jgi:hypothetical protein
VSQLLDSSGTTATKLAEQSFRRFSQLTFEEFVRRAYGLPSQGIDDFLRGYEFLEVRVYSKFARNFQHLRLLNQLRKIS